MNYLKSISTAVFAMLLFSTITFSQGMEMMKKDSMKSSMMKDKMKKEMMDKKDMKKDMMMEHKEMMHENMMNQKIDKDADGVAIKGYDPVGYFTEGKAEMGKSMHSYNWMGAEWHFKNEKHLTMFKENPEKYAPQYGGYCAYGTSKNHLSSTDPKAWVIVDGKLYLNTNPNVKDMFKKDTEDNIMKADKNWPELNKEDEM